MRERLFRQQLSGAIEPLDQEDYMSVLSGGAHSSNAYSYPNGQPNGQARSSDSPSTPMKLDMESSSPSTRQIDSVSSRATRSERQSKKDNVLVQMLKDDGNRVAELIREQQHRTLSQTQARTQPLAD